jgi:predicted esterase
VKLALALALYAACGSPTAGAPDGPTPTDARQVDADMCSGAAGTFHAQVLPQGDGIEDRIYWLHVPASYDCHHPAPLLVDFHGTATDTPEEAYQTPAITALGDSVGAIVVRPRSRSADEGGTTIYRWDENPGDIARNVTYADNLVASLEARYAIDPARVYASGFSSGSNMAAQFLLDPRSPFTGIAPIAGGFWSESSLPSLANGPRVYMSTGYRDYLWPTASALITQLGQAGLPADRLAVRHTGGGHDLYPWHFTELWQFLDGKQAFAPGAIAAPWTASVLPSPADVSALALDASGTLVAAGGHGRTWRNGASGWALDLDRGDGDYTALCFGSAGHAFVGGDYAGALASGTGWGARVAVPDYGMLGMGWINAASCRDDGSVVVAGYWSVAVASGTGTWSQLHAPTGFGVDAQLAGAATSPGGATVVAGYYDFVGRAPAGATTATAIDHPVSAEWWNGVAALPGGRFWIVGDGGAILASSDDGVTWAAQTSGTTENLYAVHFADALHGAAVGRRGTVVVTADGGATWTPRPLGEDVYVGAVLVDATTIHVAGEGGLIATSPR